MIKKAPGIEDIFPDKMDKWNYVTNTAKKHFINHNYKEIIIPILEFTEVFARGIGDETDIVSKEMFTFEDRGGRSLTLRPEGTASVVRAYCENGDYNRLATSKLFYFGPMFRAEKPQKGRLRQFNQFGAEMFGSDDPYYDYDSISMMDEITRDLGIEEYSLLINSIGCEDCRGDYITELKNYYKSHVEKLCDDCKRRLEKNPLRILDCKKDDCKSLKEDSPKISNFLCKCCEEHHTKVKEYLDNAKISYIEDDYLVRGLDYYSKTTFEFVTNALGGQNAFAAGGRYNKLVETFGGKPTPAVDFAAGIERILIILENKKIEESKLKSYIIYSGEEALKKTISLAQNLRKDNISVDFDPAPKGFKAQMKKVDREKAEFAIIIGEDEINNNYFTVKNMNDGEQQKVNENNISDFFLNSKILTNKV